MATLGEAITELFGFIRTFGDSFQPGAVRRKKETALLISAPGLLAKER
jgi:hypothetical protein